MSKSWTVREGAERRYHPKKWRKTAARAKLLTHGKCCCCKSLATEVHHAYYGLDAVLVVVAFSAVLSIFHAIFLLLLALLPFAWGLRLPIPGFEVPLWQVFPLCDYHHSNRPGCAHNFSNYQASKRSVWLNGNRYGYLWRLRLSGFVRMVLG
jgi:hypothetical protein